ncbi:MAG: cyclase family protein, partial [Gammaproteobacteria bacterium]|nr:cyclase family protein [Gammaproteobacteria bacterium]
MSDSASGSINRRRAVIGRREYLAMMGGTLAAAAAPASFPTTRSTPRAPGLWQTWDESFAHARYVCLSHVLAPGAPLWAGFRQDSHFGLAQVRPDDKSAYVDASYDKVGWTSYSLKLATENWGTHLDSPAHFHPCQTGSDEIPATYALRKLAVISIVEKVKHSKGYQATVADIQDWERRNGEIPAGSVVMVRSDWSRLWDSDPEAFMAADGEFPGVSLEAVKFLHLKRHILYHGHEAMDTDTTPTMISEDWLMANGFPQAECVANLDQVPETGALISLGLPKIKGAVAGMLVLHAICPHDWHGGVAPGEVAESPLPFHQRKLVYDAEKGVRLREA